jgi:hypothetical protein
MPDLVLLQFFLSNLPLTTIRNVSSVLISCLSILLTYWPYITLLSHFFIMDSPILACVCWMPSFFMSLLSFDWFHSATIAAILIVGFIFGWLLLWLLTIFTNWSYTYFMFRYSAILIFSALYVTAVSNRPLLPFHI